MIKIGWTVPANTGYSNILGYQVFWNGGGSAAIIQTPIHDTFNATILTYTLVPPMLVAGQSYSFAVVAYNDVTISSLSNIVQTIAA